MLGVHRGVRESLFANWRAADVAMHILMLTSLRLVLASFSLGAALLARAESTPGSAPTAAAPGRTPSPVLAVLDLDQDGTLSARELAAAPIVLHALDLNDDGKISPDERQAFDGEGRPARIWRGATTFNLVFTLDANSDGDIQSMEIANAVSSLQRLDLNADGQLTPNELRPTMVAHNRSGRVAGRSTGS